MLPADASPFVVRNVKAIVLIAALVLLSIARSAWGSRLDSVTIDEPWHITAGIEYVRTGNFRLNPEHPPLTKLVVGALAPASYRLRPIAVLREKGAERDFTEETFFLENDSAAAQQRARVAMWLLNGTLLFALGVLLWQTFGLPWAAVTLAFLAIDPTVAAHAPVVMTDLPVALALGITALGVGLLVTRWSWPTVLIAGIGMGLSLGAKHSALPGVAGLGVFLACIMVVQVLRTAGAPRGMLFMKRFAMVLAVAAIGIGLLWAQYGFHFHAGGDGSDPFNRTMADKLLDLHSGPWRAVLGFFDRYHLLPRPYLWGLADTVRAGVEGRGENVRLIWGTWRFGPPPWYIWPSAILVKLPLALAALSIVGAVVVLRAWREWPVAMRWAVATVAVMGAVHLFALSRSQGTYAGVRHALPVVVALAIVAGATAARAAQARSRVLAGVVAAGLAAAFVMTIGESRTWEYHNQLVGGTAGASSKFGSEGIDLGQRIDEIARFNRKAMASTGLPVYSTYDYAEEAGQALGLKVARRVVDLTDTNRAGAYDGFFIYTRASHVPEPHFGWDPITAFAGLKQVASVGVVEIWRGKQLLPKARARAMFDRIVEYVYKAGGTDWALVAVRCEEILQVAPGMYAAAIEMGNAYVRLGRRDEALRAYGQPLAQPDQRMLGPLERNDLVSQIARIRSGVPLGSIRPLRNPWME